MKRTAFASLFALALAASAAHAEAPIGGGSATISGGGDNMQIAYSTGGAGGGSPVHSQSGQVARFVGSNDGMQVGDRPEAGGCYGRARWRQTGGEMRSGS